VKFRSIFVESTQLLSLFLLIRKRNNQTEKEAKKEEITLEKLSVKKKPAIEEKNEIFIKVEK
jgi:hypothetical protein